MTSATFNPLRSIHDLPLRLALNNAITNDPCVWCGARTDPCGVDVFIAGEFALVCDQCAEESAPGLAEIGRRLAFLYDHSIDTPLRAALVPVLAELQELHAPALTEVEAAEAGPRP